MDEALHFNATAHILNIWRTGQEGQEWVDIANECEQEVLDLFRKAVQQEKDWAAYLFKDGGVIGLNENILCDYVEYITDQRIQTVGFPPLFNHKSNPLPWMKNWLETHHVQVAPQETEISSYLVGQIDASVDQNELSGLSL